MTDRPTYSAGSDLDVSPPQGIGVVVYPAGATFGPRRLGNFEFVWMIEGDAKYVNHNVTVAAPVGSIILCTPGSVDSFRWDTRRRTRHAYFHFDLHQYPSRWPRPDEWPMVRCGSHGNVLSSLFRHVLEVSGRADPIQMKCAIATMIAAFVSGHATAGEIAPDRTPEPVERAIAYVDRILGETPSASISVSELAAQAYVSPEHLCRVFKATRGMTPAELIRRRRIEYAAMFLARSNYTVAEIAEITGFATAYHFARVFKSIQGETPTAYRARTLGST